MKVFIVWYQGKHQSVHASSDGAKKRGPDTREPWRITEDDGRRQWSKGHDGEEVVITEEIVWE